MKMFMGDPYNFPMPNRKDLMSLGVLDAKKDGFKMHTKDLHTGRGISNNLYTNDIEGAVPKQHGSKQTNKPTFGETNLDIDRSYPKQLHIGLYKPEYGLNTQDIEGSQPNIVKFKTQRIGTNPLNPTYNVSQVEKRPITPPRYIRDSISIDDIDGAKPKKVPVYEVRNVIQVDDIQGAAPRRAKVRNTKYDNLDYSDITKSDFISKREVNPLNPSYMIRGEDGSVIPYGEIEGSCPKHLSERKKGPTSMDLNIGDIEGASAGTKGLGPFANRARKGEDRGNVRGIGAEDIAGAQAGSLLKGVKTNRVSNPLAPDYQNPGRNEVGSSQTNMFGSAPQREVLSQKESQINKAKERILAGTTSVEKIAHREGSRLAVAGGASLGKNLNRFYAAPSSAGGDDRDKMTREDIERSKRMYSGNAPQLDVGMLRDSGFKTNNHRFYGEPPSERALLENNKKKFYDIGPVVAQDATGDCGLTMENVRKFESAPVNQQSKIFERNQKHFYGEMSSVPSSKGSIFQLNAAKFHGYEPPAPGERPYKSQKINPGHGVGPQLGKEVTKPPSRFARDPKYLGNSNKFWGNEKKQEQVLYLATKPNL